MRRSALGGHPVRPRGPLPSPRSCQREDGSEDPKKGTQLLDIYALEIQMATEQRNNKRLKKLYQQVGGGAGQQRVGGGAGPQRVGGACSGAEGTWRGRTSCVAWCACCVRTRFHDVGEQAVSQPRTAYGESRRLHDTTPAGADRQVRHPAPAHHGHHPGVRRQDAHARPAVERGGHRLLRGGLGRRGEAGEAEWALRWG